MYWIPRHVYLCLARDGAVWLDTVKDRYSGMSCAAFHRLRPMLHGQDQSDLTSQDDPHVAGDAERDIAEQLIGRGLLTRDSRIGKPFSPATVAVPRFAVPVRVDISSARVGARHWCTFFYACTAALISLRGRSLYCALERARRMKAASQTSRPQSTDLAFELMDIFGQLRMYVYTAKRACLYDSLAAFEFLSHYGVFPKIVIGVRASPFSAHCWIQHEDSVLNGQPAYCAEFVPILVL
jgi:Transglutaminase-like superfamily